MWRCATHKYCNCIKINLKRLIYACRISYALKKYKKTLSRVSLKYCLVPICIFFRSTDRLNRKLEMQNEVTIEEGEMEKKIESKVLVNPFSPKCSSSSVAWQKSTFFIKCTYFCIYRQRTLHCSRGTTHDNVWRYKGHLFLILMMEKEWMNLRLKLT